MTRPRSKRTAWLAAITASIVVHTPGVAQACSVCTSGREEESQLAFILTTVFLSVLPVAMVGGIVWWLRRQFRERDAAAMPVRAIEPAPLLDRR